MRSVLRHGDVAVDVGAYKGGYTYWMREAVGDAGTVFAFEPQPELAYYPPRLDGSPSSWGYWRCVIFRGPNWQKDTLPAPPVPTQISCSDSGVSVNTIQ